MQFPLGSYHVYKQPRLPNRFVPLQVFTRILLELVGFHHIFQEMDFVQSEIPTQRGDCPTTLHTPGCVASTQTKWLHCHMRPESTLLRHPCALSISISPPDDAQPLMIVNLPAFTHL